MDEAEVFALIAKGEDEGADFKRELDLSSAASKAEFIKDVISIANSVSDTGYILIGVDNSKVIVGISKLEEEQIQQVAHSYITPPLNLKCSFSQLHEPSILSIGIIEVRPTTKPHKVARAIERLNQHDVFVRHGSIITKASPEEIIAMSKDSQISSEVRQYVRAAEIHLRLDDFQKAISAYSKALDIAPIAEFFLARGRAYALSEVKSVFSDSESINSAHKDFTSAIKLSASREIEKQARSERLKTYKFLSFESEANYDAEQQDIQWLRDNTTGREHGEVLYLEADSTDGFLNFADTDPEDGFAKLSKAIEVGYDKPEAYALRAEASLCNCNFGLALRDINTAIEHADADSPKLARYLFLRAAVSECLIWQRPYKSIIPYLDQAYRDVIKAHKLALELEDEEQHIKNYSRDPSFETNFLYHLVLNYERNNRQISELSQKLVQLISLSASIGKIQERFPVIAPTVRKIVGEDFWQANKARLELPPLPPKLR